MSWFTLKKPMGTNYTVAPEDVVSTKKALNELGYYDVPPHRGIDDWTDDALFEGIRDFQKNNRLKVDGFMRPGGPTEKAINRQLSDGTAPEQKGGDEVAALSPRLKCPVCGALHGGSAGALCPDCFKKLLS